MEMLRKDFKNNLERFTEGIQEINQKIVFNK